MRCGKGVQDNSEIEHECLGESWCHGQDKEPKRRDRMGEKIGNRMESEFGFEHVFLNVSMQQWFGCRQDQLIIGGLLYTSRDG